MKASHSSKILKHLMKGKSINPIQALNLFGCFRLSARIFDLIEDGFDIVPKTVTKGGKHFSEYSLNHQESLGYNGYESGVDSRARTKKFRN